VTFGERAAFLEEEMVLVRHSGEIPEVALHASLYYLSKDDQGPRLQLTSEEISHLEEAALARYQEIIRRDLEPANRDLSVFRGLLRASHNWDRLVRFCHRTGRASESFRLEAAEALRGYLRLELAEVGRGERKPSINCSAEALLNFALALGIEPTSLPAGWAGLCEKDD